MTTPSSDVSSLSLTTVLAPFWEGGSLCYSSDRRFFFTSKNDKIRIVDSAHLPSSILLNSDSSNVSTIAAGANNLFAIAHVNNTVRLFKYSFDDSLETSSLSYSNFSDPIRPPVKKSSTIKSMSFDPTSSLLALVTSDGTLLVYDIRASPPSPTPSTLHILLLVVAFENGSLGFCSLLTKKVFLNSSFTGKLVGLDLIHLNSKEFLVVTSHDSTVGLFSLETDFYNGKAKHLTREEVSPISMISLSQMPSSQLIIKLDDDLIVVIAGQKGKVNLVRLNLEASSLEAINFEYFPNAYESPSQGVLYGTSLSFTNQPLVALLPGLKDHEFWTVDHEMTFTRAKLSKNDVGFKISQKSSWLGNSEDIIDLKTMEMSDGKFLMFCATQTSRLWALELSSKNLNIAKKSNTFTSHQGQILSLDFLQLNQSNLIGVLATAGKDGQCVIWKIEKSKKLKISPVFSPCREFINLFGQNRCW
ncbi:hypothetical protein GEMRC1_003736 [Eukaryota sp. GEM-RC1]